MRPALAACFISLSLAGCGGPDHTPEEIGGSQVAVGNGRLVLPAVAGNPAAAYFDVTNSSSQSVALTEVEIENVGRAELTDPREPVPERIALVPIEPGETVRLSPGDRYVAATGYNSNVVPGATLQMKLTFGTAMTQTASLTVQASPALTGPETAR